MSFKDLEDNFQFFTQNGSNKAKGKLSNSTINKSLVHGEPDLPVIAVCSVPELHVMEGITNHVFNDGMVPTFGRELMEECLKDIGVSLNPRGDAMNGNNSMKLLAKCRAFLDQECFPNIDNNLMILFVECLEALKNVIDLSFTANEYDMDKESDVIAEAIQNLKIKFLHCEISITLKTHVIFCHILDGLRYAKGKKLGFFSEQCGEALHYDFIQTWKNFQVPVYSKVYSDKLLSAVVSYSSFHV